MSKIEEIRKRHQEQARRALTCGLANTPEHRDRAALLAALDGEWQSERPEPGSWWMSLGTRNNQDPGEALGSARADACGVAALQ